MRLGGCSPRLVRHDTAGPVQARRQVAQGAVGALLVVVRTPRVQGLLRILQIQKPMLRETLSPHAGVKASRDITRSCGSTL